MDLDLNLNLTKYKNIFGKPNQGFHKARLFGLARNDLLATIFLAFLISHRSIKNFIATFLILFILGVYFHWIFGVDTAFIIWLKKMYRSWQEIC